MYNGGGVPHAQFGGTTSVVGGMSSGSMNYQPQYNALVNTDSPLEMDVTMNINAQNELVIHTDVEVTGNITTTDNKVTFFLTLDVEPDWFCVVINYDRSTSFDLTTVGQTGSYDYAIPFNSSWDLTKIKGIAMVQSYNSNHRILQAATTMFSGLLPLFTTNINQGPASLGVQFNSISLPVTGIQSWEWDFDNDGTYDSTDENPYHLYETPGTYDVKLRIFDGTEYAEVVQEDCITVVAPGTPFSGELSGIWTAANNPYIVDADVNIAPENSIFIAPGTEIHMNNDSKFTVMGQLTATGSWAADIDPIVFTSDGNWSGFVFKNTDLVSTVQNCEITKAQDSAISIETDAMVDIIGNKIYGNYSAADGAAISIAGSDNVNILQNFISNNESQTLTGGISCISSIPVIKNNIIVNNSGNYAAFSLKNGSDVTLENNTIANNESAGGYHIFVFNSQISIMNSIIQEAGDIFFAPFGDPTIEYTCITGGFAGTGNIDADPMFTNPTAGAGIAYNGLDAAWTLADGSPCIDAGNPDPIYNDLDGSRNDMGAFGGQGFINLTDANEPTTPVPAVAQISIYPNPFNPSTSITLNIPAADMTKPISASIYNVKGQLVKTLVNNQVTTRTTYVWNGTDNAGNAAASGLYFVKVQTASSTTAAKMMMVK